MRRDTTQETGRKTAACLWPWMLGHVRATPILSQQWLKPRTHWWQNRPRGRFCPTPSTRLATKSRSRFCPHLQCFVFHQQAMRALVLLERRCLSVRPSVRHTLVLYQNEQSHDLCTDGEPEDSSFFADIRTIPKFERDHPEWGQFMRLGRIRTGDFRRLSHRISETVQHRTKVAIDH